MSEITDISWCDATVNFWQGCRKVSPGCKFCYMFRDKETRFGQDGNNIAKVSDKTVNKTLKALTQPSKIFTCSWSDFFIEEADEWRDDAWKIIRDNPQHQWQILTKRPENISLRLPADWGYGYENVWLGVSIEDDARKHRLKELDDLKLKKSKFKTFVSAEPLLGEIDFLNDGMITSASFENLDWLIIGGESGNENGKYKYRPCEAGWIESLIKQANEAGVPVWMKQYGTWLAKQLHLKNRHGADMSEWSEFYQRQEFPK